MRRRAVVGTAVVLGAGALGAAEAQAATFSVTNVNDSGAGSLRDAIDDANAAGGADTITFGPGAAGRIELLSPLAISDALQVNGPGAGVLTLDGNGNGSVFEVGNLTVADQAVTISGLKIVGGQANYGGGIYNGESGGFAAELTVTDSVLTGNRANEYGGGIYSDEGSLTVRSSTISRNSVGDTTGNDYGGGIMVQDTDGDTPVDVLISGSTLNKNIAYGDGGAAYFESVDNDVVIQNTTVDGNTSQEDGGGMVFCDGGGGATSNTVRIESSTFSNNTAAVGAGGVWLLCASEANVITNSTFTGNFAGNDGGGIYDDTGDVPTTITNSTVTGNEAVDLGGGVYANGGDPKVVTISSSIISGNVAGSGDDLENFDNEVFTVGNSLIGTLAGPTPPVVQAPAGTNKIGVDPQLGPLAANGGPTQTLLPALSSPAIDAGVANGLTLDQRGLPRTVGQPTVPDSAGSDGTDIGAVELAAVAAPDTTVDGAKVSAKKKQKQKGKKIVIKVKAGADEAVTAKAGGSIKLGKKKIALAKLTKKIEAGKRVTLKLKPKQKSANRKIHNALDDGDKVKASLSVTLTDAAGNKFTKKPKVTLK